MRTLVLFVSLLFASLAQGQQLSLGDVLSNPPPLNAELPTPEAVIGVKVGERHWYHHEIVRYLDTLTDASPRMVNLGPQATSYGGRQLPTYAISSAANVARLDDIRAGRAAIADPDARIDLDTQPAVVHMMYSIHGNEPSGANSTPLVAYYLTAAIDETLEAQLDDVVVIFTPMQNPDGLDRFAHWTNSHRGLNPSTDPNDREHREAVPNGRTNYYWFDLNRDWLAHQHPETRGKLAIFHEWMPNVQLDFHEQGSNSNFFFMPGKPERTHPLTPPINQQLTAKVGEFQVKRFDSDGIRYFTEERYDDFFMGKGSTYPDLFGCVGILYEQPSSRGAQQDTDNGLLTFPDSIANQFRASLASVEAASSLRSELLDYQRNFFTERDTSGGFYLAAADGDPSRLREFVRVLKGHRIEVEVLSEDLEVDGQRYAAGQSIAIPLDQPSGAYLTAIWNRQLEFEENIFYDVSTWTMPWAFNLTHTRDPVRRAKTQALDEGFLTNPRELAASNIGYLIDWRDSSSPALLYALLNNGANVRVAKRPFTAQIIDQGEQDFGYGTLFVAPELGKKLPEAVLAKLNQAAASGTPIFPVASSYTRSGIDLGSREFEVLKKPRVMIATGPGTSPYQVGEIWHLLDTRVHMPLTMVDTDRLGRVDLGEYTHLILTSPLRSLSNSDLRKISVFVESGGVVWAQGASTIDWLQKGGLTDVVWRRTERERAEDERQRLLEKDDIDEAELEALLPERRPFAMAEDEAAFRLVRGAILEGDLDISHPLGYGFNDAFLPMFRTNAKFMARSANAYSNPIVYAENPLLSGYMSEENRELAAGSAGLVVDAKGEGAVVLALDTVAFRAFWWGTQKLLLNAIFFGDLLEEPR